VVRASARRACELSGRDVSGKATMFNIKEFEQQRKSKFGSEFYYFEQVESTNATAEKLARSGINEGTVVLANMQTHGRGRSGKSWFSPPGVNLYFSMILRPPSLHLKYLPFLTALAIVRVLKGFGLKGDLKWPNDVLVDGKKICGILIQTAIEENTLQFVIVGCGINVNGSHFPEELDQAATSVFQQYGSEVSREAILASFLLEFEKLYEKIDTVSWDDFCSILEKQSTYLRGCHVMIQQNGQQIGGKTGGLDAYGGLILETANGDKTFYAGEVQLCRKV
jgi:BirA family biotin operon repressor/biotin-[acetyl-CoA-carboxylase] ligase